MAVQDIGIRLVLTEIGATATAEDLKRINEQLQQMPAGARRVNDATRQFLDAFKTSQNVTLKAQMPEAAANEADSLQQKLQWATMQQSAAVQRRAEEVATARVLVEEAQTIQAQRRAEAENAVEALELLQIEKQILDTELLQIKANRDAALARAATAKDPVVARRTALTSAADAEAKKQDELARTLGRVADAQERVRKTRSDVRTATGEVTAAKQVLAATEAEQQAAQAKLYSNAAALKVVSQQVATDNEIVAAKKNEASATEVAARAAQQEGEQLKINLRTTQAQTAEEKKLADLRFDEWSAQQEAARVGRAPAQPATQIQDIEFVQAWASGKSAQQLITAAQVANQLAQQTAVTSEQGQLKAYAAELQRLAAAQKIVDVEKAIKADAEAAARAQQAAADRATGQGFVALLNENLGKSKSANKQFQEGMKGNTNAARAFVIELRSAGYFMGGASWQGALYQVSQLGRNLRGAELAAGAAATMLALFGKALYDLVVQGAQVEQISAAFDHLALAAGEDSTALVRQMQDASRGTLAMVDAMKIANTALLANGTVFADKLPALLEIARAAAIATGQDITYTFQSLITGIARGSPKLIDNANIYLKLGDANAAYAKSLHKSVTELSAAEKQQATLNAVLLSGREFMDKIGLEAETNAEKFASLGTAVKDVIAALELTINRSGIAGYIEGIAKRLEFTAYQAQAEAEIEKLLAEQLSLVQQIGEAQATTQQTFNEWGVPSAAVGEVNQAIAGFEQQNKRRQQLIDAYNQAYADFQKELNAALTPTEKIAADDRYRKRLEELRPELAALTVELQKLRGVPVDEKLLAIAGALDKDKAAAQGATTATEAYLNKLAESGDTGLEKNAGALVSDVQKLRDLVAGFPAMPSLGGTVGETDVAALKAWFAEIQKNPLTRINEEATGEDFPGKIIAQIEQAQTAGTIGKFWEALQAGEDPLLALARAQFGYNATVDDLIAKIDKVNPTVADFMLRWQDLGSILDRVLAAQRKPIGLAGLVTGEQDAIKTLSSWAEELDKVGEHAAATKLRGPDTDQLVADIKANWQYLTTLDKEGLANWVNDYLSAQEAGKRRIVDAAQEVIDLRTQIEKLAQAARGPALPELGGTALTTDTAALRAYALAQQNAGTVSAETTAALYRQVDALANMQADLIATARTMDNPVAALKLLAGGSGDAAQAIRWLLDNFQSLTPQAQQAALDIGLLDEAIKLLVADAQQPITLDIAYEKVKAGREQLAGLGADLAKYIDPADAARAVSQIADRYAGDALRVTRALKGQNQEVVNAYLAALLNLYTQPVQSSIDYWEGEKQRAKDAARQMKKDASEVQSAIEGALTRGLDVTVGDMANTVFGKYQNVALESARRLQAIAQRGFQELKAHPDWASLLKIPEDVLRGSEGQLRTWATKTYEDVRNLLRPDMIDWEGFLRAWDEGIRQAETKQWIMDKALSELKITGRLDPKAEEEARKQIEKMFGLAEPKITFETYFKGAESTDGVMNAVFDFLRNPADVVEVLFQGKFVSPTGPAPQTEPPIKPTPESDIADRLLADATQGKGYVEVPYRLTPSKNYNPELVAPPAAPQPPAEVTAEGNRTRVAPPLYTMYTPVVAPDKIATSAQDTVGQFYTSFESALKAQDYGALVGDHLVQSMAAAGNWFRAAGEAAGYATGDAFVKAVQQRTGSVRQALARAVAGELLPELDKRYARKGAVAE